MQGKRPDGARGDGCSNGDRNPAAIESHRSEGSGAPAGATVRGYTGREVGSSLERRPRPGEFRFVPARWLVLLLTAAGVLLRGGKVAKLGVAGIVWSFTPRPLKIAVAGVAAAGAIVVVGAMAAIALLILQIS